MPPGQIGGDKRLFDGVLDLIGLDNNSPTSNLLDSIPEVPTSTTPTGLTGPNGEPLSTVDLAGGVVDATRSQADATFQSELGAQENAQGLDTTIREGTAETVSLADEALTTSGVDKANTDAAIATALDTVSNLAAEATSEFDRLRTEFGGVVSGALADVDAKADAALANVMDGRSAAMQAAVQGIHGNINTAIAKIQSDPNLTNAQKQSMIAQTRLQGASALAPAIGANILEFNKLAASVATSFGGFTAQLQGIAVGEFGALGREEGRAFADATVASQQITSTLLGIKATSDAAFANATSTLLATRSAAQNTGNELLLNNMPNLNDPVLNEIDPAATSMILGTDILRMDRDAMLTDFSMQVTGALIREQIGTPADKLWEAFTDVADIASSFF